VDQAAGRALNLTRQATRAVTLEDYETLALQTPGTCLARVAARANLHPAFPCFKAPGLVTVIVLPYLPAGRPEASPGLLRAVRSYLGPRRVLGTGLLVVGPSYVPVTVHAQVRPRAAADPAAVQTAILASLQHFFDPLLGGPEGKGWPFGRDVYRSEVLQVIDETPGVDHVASLELLGADCEPSCGNLCLGPLGLIEAGEHQIEVSSP
jgi:predicted phage baseplate assembly protein